LHDQAVRRVAKPGAAVLFQIRSIEPQLTHTRREMFRELARAMTWNDLGQHFLLHKAPRPIARSAFLVREKLLNAVVIQRSHVVRVAVMPACVASVRRDHHARSLWPMLP